MTKIYEAEEGASVKALNAVDLTLRLRDFGGAQAAPRPGQIDPAQRAGTPDRPSRGEVHIAGVDVTVR